MISLERLCCGCGECLLHLALFKAQLFCKRYMVRLPFDLAFYQSSNAIPVSAASA